VLWRTGPTGHEVCVIHRPRYDDWSLPKGKLKAGEHPLAAAVREVREETGVRGIPLRFLRQVSYRLADGTPKSVDHWSLRAAETDTAGPDGEADAVEWLPVDVAARRLSYPRDREVLDDYAGQPVDCAVVLVRHASAGERDTWPGPDEARPLDPPGERQANALAGLLALFRPVRLLAAAPVRCVRTLAPLAELADLPVEVDSAFDESADPGDREAVAVRAADRLRELAGDGEPVVVCSQGKVIPPLLAVLAGGDPAGYRTPKGDGWVLPFTGVRLVAAQRLALE
jgi:8-oxo-(d)GTP phosphatase